MRSRTGCEFQAFRYLTEHRPRFLCHVTQLNLEVHLFRSLGLTNSSDLTNLLHHAWVEHGFRAFRAVANTGWFVPPSERLLPEVKKWGHDSNFCCYHIQMLRPIGAGRLCRSPTVREAN